MRQLRQGIWASLTGGWYYDPYHKLVITYLLNWNEWYINNENILSVDPKVSYNDMTQPSLQKGRISHTCVRRSGPKRRVVPVNGVVLAQGDENKRIYK